MGLWEKLEPHLLAVRAPSQYVGGEWNAVRKDPAAVDVQVCFAFPDAYTIGMSHLGLQIFYGMINARPDALCERAFCPWPDMEERLRRDGIPLFTVDSHRAVRDFDLVGISLQTELSYTNVVNLLDLSQIPLWAADRKDGDPIVVAGGPCATYPEPIADFFDVVIVGDGEDAFLGLLDAWKDLKPLPRRDRLRRIAETVPGAYVPTIHDPARDVIKKAVTPDFENSFFPTSPIVPFGEVVFDRINLEIMRGCPHRCRFCHATSFKNRLRFRSTETLMRQAEESYKNTGLDEIALTSLSSGDYPHIHELMTRLNARFKSRAVSVSLPSLRIDEKLAELPPLMKLVRKSGFTIAPEAGSEALRRVIHKPVRDEDLTATARAAFKEGWRHVKLYFMIGLPFETDADLDAIVETARKVSLAGKEAYGRPADVNVTVSPFVPKPHTAFQFFGQKPFEYLEDVQARLKARARGSRVHLKMHDPRGSFIEAALSRGDRGVAKAIVAAHKLGGRFDDWREHFDFDRWMKAFEAAGVDPDVHVRRDLGADEHLPWDHIDVGVPRDFLWRELEACKRLNEERLCPQKTS